MKKFLLCFSILLLHNLFNSVNAQLNISGVVSDKKTGEKLPGALIIIKEINIVTQTDKTGQFTLTSTGKTAEKLKEVHLIISYTGYNAVDSIIPATANGLNISLATYVIPGKEVVITASRYNENLLHSPASIQKINYKTLQNNPTGDIYQGLGNLQGIDVINNSLVFRVFNTRGFNSTSSYRIMQFIDGADNQSAGLNFAAGNMFGSPDIDIDNIEIVSGPASALYGPNAFQGVVNMFTKNPYTNKGVSASYKIGNRNLMEGQFRIADAFGKKKRLAVKVAASYLQATEWPATDAVANRYGALASPPQNLNNLVGTLANNQALSQQDRDLLSALNTYMSTNTIANPGVKSFTLPGYNETDVFDQKANNLKLTGAVHYKFTDDMELSYGYRYAQATGVYQGNSRAVMKNWTCQQHRIQFTWKNLLVKAYTNLEDAKNTYDMVLTAANIGLSAMSNVDKAYLLQYANTLQQSTNNFTTPADQTMVNAATAAAGQSYQNQWLVPGTALFNAAYDKITADPKRPAGSLYTTRAALQHAEAQYKWNIRKVNFISGALIRRYLPASDGHIVSDTGNVKLSYIEYGAYTQADKSFFKDHLKLVASARLDKSQNYNFQFSPRIALVYVAKNQSFRLSAQSAFRSPSINDQYFYLNLGSLIVRGNVSGYNNLYTLSSVKAYQAGGNTNPGLLATIKIPAIQPEQIQSLEFGYQTIIKEKFYINFVAYVNNYKKLIGAIRSVEPKSGIAGDSSGLADINTRNYQTYNIVANATDNVIAYGGNVGVAYYVGLGITANANYSYNNYQQNTTDPLVPGFNTPKHKINVGLTGTNVYKNLGFALNFQWVDKFDWKSPFGDGPVPSYNTLDVQLNYNIKKIGSIIRIGSSNIYNNKYRQAWAAPLVGRFIYSSWTYNLNWN